MVLKKSSLQTTDVYDTSEESQVLDLEGHVRTWNLKFWKWSKQILAHTRGGMTAHSQGGFFLSRKNTRTDTNVIIDYSNTLPLRVSIIGILE